MTAAELLKALRLNADVVSEDEGIARLSITATQYGHLTKMIDSQPPVKGVDGNRLLIDVEVTDLEAAVANGKSAYQTTNISYNVQTTTLYEVSFEDELPTNEIGTMSWLPDAGVGSIVINDETYHIESATSDELFEDPANPERRQVFIRAIVEESGEEVLLTSGSPSGFLKRVVNYGKRIRKA